MSKRPALAKSAEHPEASAIEPMVRAVVRQELRDLLERMLSDEPREFSSRRGCGPAGYSERAWKSIARRIGVQRGRWWVVTRAQLDAYEAAERRKPAARIATAAPVASAANDTSSTWTPAGALAAAGLRRSR